MASSFSLVTYSYFTKKGTSEHTFNNKREALDALENFAVDYLREKDGAEKVQAGPKTWLFSNKKFTDSVKAGLPLGHYVVRDSEDHVYRLVVWRKYEEKQPGKLWGHYVVHKWNKVFDVDIVENNNNVYIGYSAVNSGFDPRQEPTHPFSQVFRPAAFWDHLRDLADKQQKLSVKAVLSYKTPIEVVTRPIYPPPPPPPPPPSVTASPAEIRKALACVTAPSVTGIQKSSTEMLSLKKNLAEEALAKAKEISAQRGNNWVDPRDTRLANMESPRQEKTVKTD